MQRSGGGPKALFASRPMNFHFFYCFLSKRKTSAREWREWMRFSAKD